MSSMPLTHTPFLSPSHYLCREGDSLYGMCIFSVILRKVDQVTLTGSRDGLVMPMQAMITSPDSLSILAGYTGLGLSIE